MTILPVLDATNLIDATLRFPALLVELRWAKELSRLVEEDADFKDLELELLIFALRFLLYELVAIFITTLICSLTYQRIAKQLTCCTEAFQFITAVLSRFQSGGPTRRDHPARRLAAGSDQDA